MNNPTTAEFTYATNMMTDDTLLTFEAWFVPTVWPLTLTQHGAGNVISISEPETVSTSYADTVTVSVGKGLPVILTATPDEGYTFAGWIGVLDPMIDSTDSTIEFIMDGSKNITASFVKAATVSTLVLPQRQRVSSVAQSIRQLLSPSLSTIIQSPDGTSQSLTSVKRGAIADYYLIYNYPSSFTITAPSGFYRGMRSSGTFNVGDILQLQGGSPLKKPLLVRVEAVSGAGAIESVKILYNTYYCAKPGNPVEFKRLTDGLLTTAITPIWQETSPCTKTFSLVNFA